MLWFLPKPKRLREIDPLLKRNVLLANGAFVHLAGAYLTGAAMPAWHKDKTRSITHANPALLQALATRQLFMHHRYVFVLHV
jgi:hypothetical protein